MPWGRAGLDVVVTTDGDRDVFLVFVGASTGLEPAGARFMMRAEPLHYFYPVQGIGTSDQMFRSPAQGKNSAVALHAS